MASTQITRVEILIHEDEVKLNEESVARWISYSNREQRRSKKIPGFESWH